MYSYQTNFPVGAALMDGSSEDWQGRLARRGEKIKTCARRICGGQATRRRAQAARSFRART